MLWLLWELSEFVPVKLAGAWHSTRNQHMVAVVSLVGPELKYSDHVPLLRTQASLDWER